MNTISPTALETAVLDRFHQIYKAQGFPPAESIRVLRRENTGGGRYVDLECDTSVQLDDGYIDLGGSFIGHLKVLEFTVYGGDFWDGEETEWRIV